MNFVLFYWSKVLQEAVASACVLPSRLVLEAASGLERHSKRILKCRMVPKNIRLRLKDHICSLQFLQSVINQHFHLAKYGTLDTVLQALITSACIILGLVES